MKTALGSTNQKEKNVYLPKLYIQSQLIPNCHICDSEKQSP